MDKNIFSRFSDINWNSLNKKHKRDYRAALLEVYEQKQFTDEEIRHVEDITAQAFEQLKNLPLKIVRKVKRGSETK